jgi:hypothetical protein
MFIQQMRMGMSLVALLPDVREQVSAVVLLR